MADVFRRTELTFGGAFSSEIGLLVPNDGLTGLLMQNLQLSYQQQVSRLYEIGQAGSITNVYYVGGRAMGQLNVAHIVGPRVTLAQFYTNYSDVCKAGTNSIRLQLASSRCNNPAVGAVAGGIAAQALSQSQTVNYTAKFCVLTQIGLSLAAEQFLINEQSSLMFSNLQYEEAGTGA